MATEEINHPTRYGGDTIYEFIKVMEAELTPDEFRGAMKFTIGRYHRRAGKKENESALRDFEKAAWYANYLVDYEKRLARDEVGENHPITKRLNFRELERSSYPHDATIVGGGRKT